MFGVEGGYVQDGVQFKWLVLMLVFFEFGVEFGCGVNFLGSDCNKNGSGVGVFYVYIGDDIGVVNSWWVGVLYFKMLVCECEVYFEDVVNDVEVFGVFSGDFNMWLVDFVWKWVLNGNLKY